MFFKNFSNTSYPNEIYFSNLTLHKLHWASPKSTTTTVIWFQTKQMAWWFCMFCMSGCKNMLESWVRTQRRTYPTPQSPQTFHCRVSWVPHQNVMNINSWWPTIQGVLWFSLLRQHTFIALFPPNPSQAHSIPTTMSQKEQLQRRSNTSYPNEIYFSNLTLHKLHWASPKSTTPQPFDFRPNKWPGGSACSACPLLLQLYPT